MPQVKTFDIAEFNAMITDPSWVERYGKEHFAFLEGMNF